MQFDKNSDLISLLPNPNIRDLDEVLGEIFDRHKLPRLGGASGNGWSGFASFQRCPYLWKVKYVDGIRGAAGKALEIGSIFHTFMALYYTWMIDDTLTLTPHVCRDELMVSGVRPESIIEGWRTFDAYTMHYEVDYLKPLAMEYWAKGEDNNTCRYDMIAEVVEAQPGIVPGTYIIEHKCLVSLEKIKDYRTGKTHTVQELHRKNIAPLVLAYDVDKRRLVHVQAEVPRPTSVRDAYEVVSDSGRRLCTSDNHPYMTARGWVPAAELTHDDWIAVAPNTAGYDGPAQFTDAEVEFVGLMLGDGHMGNTSFTKNSEAVLERFRTVTRVMGGDPKTFNYEGKATQICLSDVVDAPGRTLLTQLGLRNTLAATKFIPQELLDCPDRQVNIMLAALWNTDGCVDVFEERSKKRPNDPQLKVRIAYVSRSQQLCNDVQTLLDRAGYPSTVCESSVEYEGERRDVWTTKIVTRNGRRRFLDAILTKQIPFVRYDISEAREAIKAGDDAAIPTDYIKWQVPDNEVTGILRQQLSINHSVERETLSKHGPKKNSEAIAKVLDTELTWERVSHVVISGRSMMYDITVPGVHNFVANGIITHNTSGRFTADLMEGWHNDGEVLGQIMIWKQAKIETEPGSGKFISMDKKFGKLMGTIVNIAGKQKKPLFHRVIVPAQRWHVSEHQKDLKIWTAYRNLCIATDSWPRARNNCVGRFGMCDLFSSCSANEKVVPQDLLLQIQKRSAKAAEPVASSESSQTELASDVVVSEEAGPPIADATEHLTQDPSPLPPDLDNSIADAIVDSTDL